MKKFPFLYYLKYTGIAVLFLLLIVLYVLEFPYFSNTFEVKKLVLFSIILGAAFGTFLGFRYQHLAKDSIESFQVYSLCIVLSVMLMPLVMSLSNRLLSFRAVQQEQVELFQVEPYLSDRFGVLKGESVQASGYYIFFIRNGNLERIKTMQELFNGNKKGDIISIPVLKGLWGYEVVIL